MTPLYFDQLGRCIPQVQHRMQPRAAAPETPVALVLSTFHAYKYPARSSHRPIRPKAVPPVYPHLTTPCADTAQGYGDDQKINPRHCHQGLRHWGERPQMPP